MRRYSQDALWIINAFSDNKKVYRLIKNISQNLQVASLGYSKDWRAVVL